MCSNTNMSSHPQGSRKHWRVEPLANYKAPAIPTRETLRKKFKHLLRRLRPSKPALWEEFGQLETAPAEMLDRAAPRPELTPFFVALDAVVDEWLALSEPKNRVMVIVLPPCDEFDLMRTWARKKQAEIAPDPSGESVLNGDTRALPSLEGEELLVIPELERWFRRHHSGLALIRELIARLSTTNRRCVIGVNSWAWSYVAVAADGTVELPPPLTLASFDDEALCLWLSGLAESAQARRVVFRNDKTGDIIFDPHDHGSMSEKNGNGNGSDLFLKKLAAVSRGSPWLAWHIFRDSMRVVRADTDNKNQPEPHGDDPRDSIWIDPVAEVALPALPQDVRFAALLVLHALLLHGELDLAELANVLPPIDPSHIVHRLAAEQLVLERRGKWRVAPAGYPAVRDALSHAGFPIDQL